MSAIRIDKEEMYIGGRANGVGIELADENFIRLTHQCASVFNSLAPASSVWLFFGVSRVEHRFQLTPTATLLISLSRLSIACNLLLRKQKAASLEKPR